MLTDADVAEVREYFGVFNPVPAVALDEKQNTADEAYILIEGGGLSIGKHDVGRLGSVYRVYDHEGDDDGITHFNLPAAVKAAMGYYAAELFRRVNDRLATAAQAAEFAK